MIGVFLSPITTVGQRRQPDALAASRACAKRLRGYALSQDALDTGLFVCEADDFTPIVGQLGVTLVQTARTFAEIHDSDALYADVVDVTTRVAIANAAARVGVGVIGAVTLKDVVRSLATKLEPAAYAGMFDTPTPNKTGTIVDPFTTSLDPNWIKPQGNGTFTVSGGQLVWTRGAGGNTVEYLARNDAGGFANNQWSQGLYQWQTAAPGAQTGPGIRCALTGTKVGYLIELQLNDAMLQRFSGATLTYISDWVATIAAATQYTVKLDGTGTTLTAFFSGSSIGSATDSTIAAGVPAMTIAENAASAGTCALDDFQCPDALGGGDTLLGQGVM